MFDAVHMCSEISDEYLESLSDDLRAARRTAASTILAMAADYLGDLYSEMIDQGNPDVRESYIRGRIRQIIDDVDAEIEELKRIEKIELNEHDLRILGALYECSPMGSILMAELLKTSNYGRNFIVSRCHHLEGAGFVRNRIVPAAGYDHWFITDAGRQRYDKELASARA
jgi:hypothetical protein